MREHCLMEFDFHDVYLKQKQLENKAALSLLPSYLEKLQSMDFKDRHEELALGFLAGNVFDWGAKEVALLMEADKMDFEAAKKHVGPRPWLIDNVDPWLERMEGEPHNSTAAASSLTTAARTSCWAWYIFHSFISADILTTFVLRCRWWRRC